MIVDNRAGASSNIGIEAVVRANLDGCTALLGGNTGIVINRNPYIQAGYRQSLRVAGAPSSWMRSPVSISALPSLR